MFRLLRAERAEESGVREVEFQPPLTPAAYAIIIGINGTGKSRFLGDLARAFLSLESLSNGGSYGKKRAEVFPFSTLEYEFYGFNYRIIRLHYDKIRVFKDGVEIDPAHLDLPSRVIGLTISPFDKFPLPYYSFSQETSFENERYAYIGSRTRSGRTGSASMLYGALENLAKVDNIEDPRRGPLAGVFEFLNYEPEVKFNYSSRYGRSLLENLGDPAEFEKAIHSFTENRVGADYIRLQRLMRTGSLDIHELYEAMRVLRDYGSYRISVAAELTSTGFRFTDARLLPAVSLLRRLGFLVLRSVDVFHRSGAKIDMLDASSGELSILTSFLGLASSIENNSLILIDEPEISLHPEWQRQYLDLLSRAFSHYDGCHFIIATHSPLIVSDAPSGFSQVISLDRTSYARSISSLSGESSDFVLVNAFKVATERNYYIRDLVANALKMMSAGETQDDEFHAVMEKLRQIRTMMDQQLPIAQIIRDMLSAYDSHVL